MGTNLNFIQDGSNYYVKEGKNIVCPNVIESFIDKDELLFSCNGYIMSINEPSKNIIIFLLKENIEKEIRLKFKESFYNINYVKDYINKPYDFSLNMIKYGMGLY